MSYCTFGAAHAMPDQPEGTIYLRERCRLCLCTKSSVKSISPARNCIFVGFGHLRLEAGFPLGSTDEFGANTSFDQGGDTSGH